MKFNPLLRKLHAFLPKLGESISEYELLKQVEIAGLYPELAAHTNLALFQKHFLLMNALYTLQKQGFEEKSFCLHISPTAIYISSDFSAEDSSALSMEHKALATYYLDESNWENASRESVEALLDSFWKKYLGWDAITQADYAQALQALQLPETVTLGDAKKQYRKLAQCLHPDKGGSKEEFLALQAHYAVVLRVLESQI